MQGGLAAENTCNQRSNRATLYRWRQVYSPVLWVRTVEAMIAGGATRIVECGPGKVLAGLTRRIVKNTPVTFIDNSDSLQKALQD